MEENQIASEPYLEIIGGNPLHGEVSLPGAKNSALPALVAACLSDEEVTLHNVPLELNDVKLLIELLKSVGASIHLQDGAVVCSGQGITGGVLDSEKAGKIRHSLLIMGCSANWGVPLFLPLPGGCGIGNRKHDFHVHAFRDMGLDVYESELGIHLKEGKLRGDVVLEFPYPSFGATLNVLFASVRARGSRVVLKNAAINPEVQDVIDLLGKMGGQIRWIDNRTVEIIGVDRLHGTTHAVMPDRIVAATCIAAVGAARGQIAILNGPYQVLTTEIDAWRKAGLTIEPSASGIEVKCDRRPIAVDIVTEAYPGFHTDIQPLHTVLMTFAEGTSVVKETILDNRFAYCHELNRMGASIKVVPGDFTCVNGKPGQVAIVEGTERLYGADLKATDIRGGAATVVAALGADGMSRIMNLYQLERGYGNITGIFQALGANIVKRG